MPIKSATDAPFRLQRSSLFVPATTPRFFEKAANSAADGIILDLEDAVSPDKKEDARAAAIQALNGVEWGSRNMAVRINGLETPLTYKDVVGLVENCPRLDLIVLPMVNTPNDVYYVSTMIEQIERGLGRARRVGIEGIIETPLGMENVSGIAAAGGRLEALSFGAGDYAVGMKMRNRKIGSADPNYAIVVPGAEGRPAERHLADQWHFAMARLANACRAHGLRPRDSAYADFKDLEGYRASCLRAASLGFEGKSCIHPSQIDVANEVFSPSPQEVTWARGLLAAMQRGMEAGKGAVQMGGEMVDLANIKLAENILAKADHIAAKQ
ncbi:MAG TPA: CoA ester lyase [bacterium]|nr:CoA ester lyase [bacterium]